MPAPYQPTLDARVNGRPVRLSDHAPLAGRSSRPLQHYVNESKRLLGVLDRRLDGRDWVMFEYSIADISMLGWVRNLITFYEARELSRFDGFGNVVAWLDRGLARPAVQRGLAIPAA